MAAHLIIRAYTKANSALAVVSGFQYFFDVLEENANDPISLHATLEGSILVLVAPWLYEPRSKDGVLDQEKAKWVGLVVQQNENDSYIRKGVFVGPSFADDLGEWEQKTLKLIQLSMSS